MRIVATTRLPLRQILDAFKHVPPVILPTERDGKHLDFAMTLIDQKVEHGPSLRRVTAPRPEGRSFLLQAAAGNVPV